MNASQTMAGRQFIAGRRVASGEATLLSLRAVDGEATGHRFYPASREEAAQAAEAAQQAFAVYSQTTPQQRARFLNAVLFPRISFSGPPLPFALYAKISDPKRND